MQKKYSKLPSTQNLNQKGCQPDNHSLNELCERYYNRLQTASEFRVSEVCRC
jgi:hypothetical protein